MLASSSGFCRVVSPRPSVFITRRGYATRRRESTKGRQLCDRWHLERLRAICEIGTRSPQHEPTCRIDEAAFGSARPFSTNLLARERSVARNSLNGTVCVICLKGSPLAPRLKIVSCGVFSLNGAAVFLVGMGKFVATATVMFATCGSPSITGIRIELTGINWPIIIENA